MVEYILVKGRIIMENKIYSAPEITIEENEPTMFLRDSDDNWTGYY